MTLGWNWSFFELWKRRNKSKGSPESDPETSKRPTRRRRSGAAGGLDLVLGEAGSVSDYTDMEIDGWLEAELLRIMEARRVEQRF